MLLNIRLAMRLFIAFLAACALAPIPRAQTAADTTAIFAALADAEEGWNTGDVELATRRYADNADWTNAFGDRVVGRDSLVALLTEILSLDFVRAGRTEYVFNDVTFLSADVALLRSRSVVRGQRQSDGVPMADRHNDHLRVFQQRDGTWVIVSHLISQANEKR